MKRKKVLIILGILLVLFLIGCFTTNSHVASIFTTTLESIVALISGIAMNIAHGASWIVNSITKLI